MKQKTNKMLIFTSLAAYFTYFIHGIGASILGQYKPEFAAAWGAKPLADGTLDVSMVVSVIAALGPHDTTIAETRTPLNIHCFHNLFFI